MSEQDNRDSFFLEEEQTETVMPGYVPKAELTGVMTPAAEDPAQSAAPMTDESGFFLAGDNVSDTPQAANEEALKAQKAEAAAKKKADKEARKQKKAQDKAAKKAQNAEKKAINETRRKEIEERLEKDPRTLKEASAGVKRKLVIAGLVILAVVVAVILFSDRFYNTVRGEASYILKDTGVTATYIEGNTTMLLHDGNLLRCSQDGLQALNERGNVVYDIPFTMSSPYVVNAGPYVSVADRLGMNVIVVRNGQTQTTITTESTIVLNTVNELGQAAVVLSAENGNIVNLYSARGETLLQRRTYSTSDGIPLAVALAPDGSRMATVYVNYTGTVLQSIVSVFDLTESGSAMVDRILGSMIFEDTVISDIKFIDNKTLFYAGADRVGEMNVSTGVGKIWETILTYEVSSLSLGENFFAIRFGDGRAGVAEPAAYNLIACNYNGELLTQQMIPNLDYLDVWGDTIVYASGRSYNGISSSGKPKWTMNSGDNFSRLVAYKSGKVVACAQNGVIHFYKVTLRTAEGEGYVD